MKNSDLKNHFYLQGQFGQHPHNRYRPVCASCSACPQEYFSSPSLHNQYCACVSCRTVLPPIPLAERPKSVTFANLEVVREEETTAFSD
jgi:hypothetical protein